MGFHIYLREKGDFVSGALRRGEVLWGIHTAENYVRNVRTGLNYNALAALMDLETIGIPNVSLPNAA